MLTMFKPVKLIDEVKKRPGLYSTEPTDREVKLALWKEVGAAIFPDWDQCNKATAYDRVLQLQRKWRSLRDAYGRELRARRSGVRVNKRVYMYFKRMSFLGGFDGDVSEDSLPDDKDDINDTIHDNTIEDDPLTRTTILFKPVKKPRRRRIKKPSVESELEEVEREMPVFEAPEENADSDKLFMLSFVPEMRKLPGHIKMWTRAQIANVMQEAVTWNYSDTAPCSSKNGMDIKRQRRESSEKDSF